MKPAKYLLSLATAMLLLAVMAVPVSADAGDTTTVTANLAESITINAPTGKTEVILAPETTNDLKAASGNVTANVDYDVTAVDAMEEDKDAGDAGKMVDWEDTAKWTTANQLTNAVEVGSSMGTYGAGAAAISATPITIISNAPANPGTAVDSEEIIQITTVSGDKALATSGHWYQITITFTASKHTA